MPKRSRTIESIIRATVPRIRHRSNSEAQQLADRIRSGAAWQRCRAAFLRAHPLCRMCEDESKHTGEPIAAAVQVHHIIPVVRHPALAYDLDNLMPVCILHHARIEAKEKSCSRVKS